MSTMQAIWKFQDAAFGRLRLSQRQPRRDYERTERLSSRGVQAKGGCDDRTDPPGSECTRAAVGCGVRVGQAGVETGADVRPRGGAVGADGGQPRLGGGGGGARTGATPMGLAGDGAGGELL